MVTVPSSQPEIYQGQFGEFTITDRDRQGVIIYRISLLIASIAFAVGSFLVVWQGATSLILGLLTPLFAIFSLGLGIALLTIHIYLIPLHRLLQFFWLFGTISAVIFAGINSVTLAEFVYNNPTSLLGIGFIFAALTGIYFKEAFCFNRVETKLLTPLVPVLLLGHLFSILSTDIEQILLMVWAGLFLVFSVRKLGQTHASDIGDKSVFTYLKQKQENKEN